MMPQKFLCQDDIKEIMSTSPWLLIILGDITMWSLERGLPCVITSLLRPEDDGISESKTHQEGRAMDLSVKGWSEAMIKALANYINIKYEKIGAISSKTGKPNTCYYHNNGNGWHFHIQVRPIIKGVSVCLS